MEEFLNYVLKTLAEYPDDVIVSKAQEDRKVMFHVKLRSSDVGKVVGRNGHVIGSIRQLVSASASRQGLRATVDIVEA